ncbi:hypothetical protein ACS0TY_006177 [Phlomoides rotata]
MTTPLDLGNKLKFTLLLLDKYVMLKYILSRVVQLGGEPSYHIFYQLCSGAHLGLKRRLKLKRVSEYNYLNLSDCLEITTSMMLNGFILLREP